MAVSRAGVTPPQVCLIKELLGTATHGLPTLGQEHPGATAAHGQRMLEQGDP